jgi:hypothetical protein
MRPLRVNATFTTTGSRFLGNSSVQRLEFLCRGTWEKLLRHDYARVTPGFVVRVDQGVRSIKP